VNESDLVFEKGFPGPLRPLAGIGAEELDPLWKGQSNKALPVTGNDVGLSGEYAITTFCELIHTEGAEVLATYAEDWYAGRPVLTRHRFGRGEVYYLAAKVESRFVDDLMGALASRTGLSPSEEGLPAGVVAQARTDGTTETVFTMNFNDRPERGLAAYGVKWETRPQKSRL